MWGEPKMAWVPTWACDAWDAPRVAAARQACADGYAWVCDHPYYASTAATVVLSGARRGARRYRNRLPKQTMLEVDLDTVQFMETRKDALYRSFYKKKETFTSVLNVLEAAESDARVKGLMVRVGRGKPLGAGRASELRAALQRYHKKTKQPVVCYADSFGESGPVLTDYWVASACTHVVMPSCGQVNVTALQATGVFFKSLLAKLGVAPNILTRRAHKTAANPFLEDRYTDEHRAQVGMVLETLGAEVRRDLKERAPLKDADTVLEDGPYTAAAAMERGLVDYIHHLDDFVDDVLPGLTGVKKEELAFRSLAAYAPHAAKHYGKAARPWDTRKPKVAEVVFEGRIHEGASKKPLGYNGASIGGDTGVAQLKAVRAAVAKKQVQAVLVRVDSGGGSALASMRVHHQLQKLAAAVPVVVSCANVAGSGGYLIALPARRLFVNPTTIAGSIGVINGKVSFHGLLENLGASQDEVKTADNATYFSPLHPYGSGNRARVEAMTDHVYGDFKNLVAAARGKTAEEVEALAQGQIYFGRDAVARGLATDLGGYHDALSAVAEELKLPSRHALHVVPYPRARGLAALFGNKAARNRADRERAAAGAACDISLSALAIAHIPGFAEVAEQVLQRTAIYNELSLSPGAATLASPLAATHA